MNGTTELTAPAPIRVRLSASADADGNWSLWLQGVNDTAPRVACYGSCDELERLVDGLVQTGRYVREPDADA